MGAPAPRRKSRVIFEVGLAFITAGVVVLLFVGYELVGTNLTEQHNQARLAREFNKALAVGTRPGQGTGRPGTGRPGTTAPGTTAPGTTTAGGAASRRLSSKGGAARAKSSPGRALGQGLLTALPVPPPGGALDHLVIPAIGVDRYVVEGVGEANLQEGPGHYPGTPLPGERGNVGIAGHRTTYGAPFFRLNELAPGDLVYLTDTSGTTWAYSVQRSWVVSPSDVAVLDPSQEAELTLTTCNPRFEATSRLVVRALLVAHLTPGTRSSTRDLPTSLASLGSSKATAHSAPEVTAKLKSSAAGSALPVVTKTASNEPASGGSGSGEGSPTVSAASGGAQVSALLGAGSGWVAAQLAVWALLALGAWVAVRLLAAKRCGYSKGLVVLGGAVLCLLPLWFAFENAVVLLPANF